MSHNAVTFNWFQFVFSLVNLTINSVPVACLHVSAYGPTPCQVDGFHWQHDVAPATH